MEKEDYEKYLRDNITKTKDVKELSWMSHRVMRF